MVIEVVLEALKSKVAAGGDVLWKVIKVDRLFGTQVIFIDGNLVEIWMRFDGTDILGKMMMVKESENRVVGEELLGMQGIGV